MTDMSGELQRRVVTPRRGSWIDHYRALAEIKFGVPRLAPLGLVGGVNVPSLDAVYVDQYASRSLALPASSEQTTSAAIAVADSECVLVVGDSGIGKTTLLTVAALRSMQSGRIPIMLELASAEGRLVEAAGGRLGGTGLRFDAIVTLILGELQFVGIDVGRAEVERLLQDGQVSLFLDGLNELHDTRLRNMLLAMIPAWQQRWAGLRVVISTTASPLDEGTVVTPHGMDVMRIAPFGFEQAGGFLDTFIAAARPELTASARQDLWQPALRRLRGNPEIFGYPLYLTAIAVTLASSSRMSLDEDLHSSYDVLKRIARWLVEHHAAISQYVGDPGTMFRVVSAIAAFMSMTDSRPRSSIGFRDAVTAIARQLPALATQTSVENFISEMCAKGGLLRRRWGDLTMLDLIRDFFTSQYLATTELQSGEPEWKGWIARGLSLRENHSILRLLPLAILENSGSDDVRKLYNEVVSTMDSMQLDVACDAVAVLTNALRDLTLRGFPAIQLSDDWRETVLRLQATVAGDSGPVIALRSRVSLVIASSLSLLPKANEFRSRIAWFRQPSEFVVGAQATDKDNMNFDPDAAPWELKPKIVQLAPFGIGCYLVTVTEFEEFLEDGGYGNQSYWSGEGHAWLSETCNSKPLDWEVQLVGKTCPVTGVSYYEAEAYAAWARRHGSASRLPREAEWEYAARCGSGKRFPWGDTLSYGDMAEANWAGAGLRSRTPVGLFARFGTPDNIHDLVGNVEEWCADGWDADQEEYKHVGLDGKYVVKGGSCIRYRRLCRPAYRSRILAGARYHTLGFRLAFDVSTPS